MMDSGVQDRKSTLINALIRRDQERKEKLEILKKEKELSGPDDTKTFNATFENHHKNIMAKIKILEENKVEQDCLSDYINDVNNDIQVLNNYFSTSTRFLSNFNVRKGLQTVDELRNKLIELEKELVPKKKFSFRPLQTKPEKKSGNIDKAAVDVVDSESKSIKKTPSYSTISCGFSNEKDKILKLNSDEIVNKYVELSNLENCTIFLFGNPITVQISNVLRCKILCGPVTTSVMVDGCEDCDFALACQQLRIHSTQNSRFYIHVTSRAIIEGSSGVKFAPYNLLYDGINEHFKSTGLDWSVNNWQQIDDFNWLVRGEHSPNWQEIHEEDRIRIWPL